MRLSFFLPFSKKGKTSPQGGKQGLLTSRRVVVLFSPRLTSPFRAGGHGEAVIPVPIPNTEVKRPIAEGSAGPARARVGRRRPFSFRWLEKKKGPPAIAAQVRGNRSGPFFMPRSPQMRITLL